MLPLAIVFALLAPLQEGATRYENWPDGSLKAKFEVRVEPDGREVRHGAWVAWYPDGTQESEGAWADGAREGEWTFWWPGGKRKAAGSFEAGRREGTWRHYDEGGRRVAQGRYRAGRRDGNWTYWGEDRKVDAARSGTYSWHSGVDERTGLVWEGEVRDGTKDGVWRLVRPDGSPAFVGHYGPAGPEGPWAFLHADGTLDREWLSGEYRAGRRLGPLEALPEGLELQPPDREPDPRRAPALACDPVARAALEVWLAAERGAREQPLRALLADRQAAFVAAVARLQELDLAGREGDALGRRLNDDLLGELLGVAFEWIAPAEAGAARANALTALRWRALTELVHPGDPDWQRLLDPRWHWIELGIEWTPLGAPPLPGGFASTRLEMPEDAARTRGRIGSRRLTALRAEGGTGTEEAVKSALDWLARTQSDKGGWEVGTPRDVEATAFALLALLGDGHQPDAGVHAESVRRGLEWLVRGVRPHSGQIRSLLAYDLRSHALALQAVAEGAWGSELPALLETARRARDFLLEAQLPDGSWPRDWAGKQGETLTTVYAWFALRTLQETRVGCAPEPLERGLAWLDAQTGPDGATAGDDVGRLPVATAWTALCRLLAGRDPDGDSSLAAQIDWLIAHPTSITLGDPLLDSEYVCLGAHVLYQVGGEAWKNWNATMKTQLLQVQKRSGPEAGSWEPADVGPPDFTTVTALRALTFEVYYRIARLSR